jgi:hypothetical protein|tara:strand:- start:335 stop:559 length:225 start_codon:yes stop_codon:yes gene_type:complete
MNCQQIENEIRELADAGNCSVEEVMQKACPHLVRLAGEPDQSVMEMVLDNSDSLAAADEDAEMVLHGLYSDAEV